MNNMPRKLFLLCLVSVLTLVVNAETFVVAVGVANYQNISKLVLSENDAKTIAKLYKTKTRNVITMTGRYATRANIIKAMSDQFRRARKGDMVVLFFSGHGMRAVSVRTTWGMTIAMRLVMTTSMPSSGKARLPGRWLLQTHACPAD